MKNSENFLRVGKISSCNYENGTARVVYKDRDDCTTIELPFMSPFEEYYIPEVDDLVWVLHLPNGSSKGLILGRYWSKHHTPPEGVKQGIRRKDLSRHQGKCYWQYADSEVGEGNDGTMTCHTDDDIDATIDGDAVVASKGDVKAESQGSFSIKGASSVKLESDGSLTIKGAAGLSMSCSAGINIDGSGLTTIDGINFRLHTHNCTAPGSPSGPPV